MSTASNIHTASQILDVAEAMFSEEGYRAVSLRSITRTCEANIAAIHYHFGSKKILLDRIFERRSAAINDERLRLLAACRKAKGRPALLEQILDAYLRPSIALPNADEGTRRFMRLRAVVAHEHAELSRAMIAKYFNEASGRFIEALTAELAHLSPEDVFWRFHFLLGAQYFTLANPGRIQALSDGRCDPSDAEPAIAELVAFAAAGFRAPARDRTASRSAPLREAS